MRVLVQKKLDLDVIARAQHGDAEAFEAIVAARLQPTWRLVRSIGGDEVDADDVAQDVFLMVWRDLPALRDPGAFDGWLRAIAVNAIRHAVRRRGPIRLVPMADIGGPSDGGGWHAERELETAVDVSFAERDALARAFARLSIDERAVLALRYLDGCSMELIAKSLKCPVGTVKSRLNSARSALRSALDAEAR
jgi:RNA polymerase sigma-70 factor (ECF subfamily)